MRALLLLLVCVAWASSAATIYRCEGPGGVVEFSYRACEGQSGSTVELHPENRGQLSPQPRRLEAEHTRATSSRYVRPLTLEDDHYGNFQRVKAVVEVGGIKARQCDWDMKVNRRMNRCDDFMEFLADGSEYSQALSFINNLPATSRHELGSQLRSVERVINEISQVQLTLMAYIRSG